MSKPRMFLVDVESSGPSPFSSVCTEVGVVDFETRQWMYLRLWPWTPHPQIPALPVVAAGAQPSPAVAQGSGAMGANTKLTALPTLADAWCALDSWVASFQSRPILVSDNPGFDAPWVAYGFDEAGLDNPFGHSSRRIGDLAAGLSNNWRATSSWKKLRQTRHDHNPVNDALGNAEALAALLKKHQQKL